MAFDYDYTGNIALLDLPKVAFFASREVSSEQRRSALRWAEQTIRTGDAVIIGDICRAIFARAARAVCANISAILVCTDRGDDPAKPACVCADGSVIRHSAVFQQELQYYLNSFTRAILGRHAVLDIIDDSTTLGTAAAALLE